MNPWIASDLARLRHDEVGREAERRSRAMSSAGEVGRHSGYRWLGHLLIRAGRRLGGDADLGRSPLPNLGTLDLCEDGPGSATVRRLQLRLHAD
jgi:hypothetical protein